MHKIFIQLGKHRNQFRYHFLNSWSDKYYEAVIKCKFLYRLLKHPKEVKEFLRYLAGKLKNYDLFNRCGGNSLLF